MSIFKALSAGYKFLVNCLVYVGLSLIIFMMLIVAISVFLRNTPYAFGWQLEVAEYILILSTFLGTGWLLREGGHIRVDVIPTFLTGRSQRVYNGVIYTIVAATCLTLFIVGAHTAWEAYVSGTLQIKVYTFPKWILLSVIPFGTIFLVVESLKMACRYFKQPVILVVDDEFDVIETLKESLGKYRVDAVHQFEDGQKKLAREIYDAVILDIMGVRGLDLLKLSIENDYPTIMLTAHALTPEALNDSMKSGAVSFVPKERMEDIELYVEDALTMGRDEARLQFYRRLGDFFERKFGPDWDKKKALLAGISEATG
ncbi:MAG: TRAP transporter small permease subunit [Deltaproteobacteria bacterium]|nr:TRAP transporter small permease subunit [Deltaproteobacteria bacterium]